MAKQPHTWTEKELEEAAGHITYEKDKLDLAEKIRDSVYEQNPEVGHLILEAELIHVRNLLDFFFVRQNARPTDVTASLYVTTGLPSAPSWLQGYRDRIDQMVSHLTLHRVSYMRKSQMEWSELPQNVIFIKTCWNEFMARLQPHQKKWFQRPVSFVVAVSPSLVSAL
jgi:hypothetical protein